MFGLFRKSKIRLEFRSKGGDFMFGLKNESAEVVHRHLCSIHEVKKTTRRLKKESSDEFEEFIVFECIEFYGFTFGQGLEVALQPGDYIKIIQ